MADPRDGADRVGHGEATLGEAQSSNPPVDPEYIREDAPEGDNTTPDPEPVQERGNEDPAPNAP